MSSGRFTVDFTFTSEGLNQMLPQVVGAIEDLDEAYLYEIKNHMEAGLNRKISDTVLENALNNGIKLGIVKMRREFKVCKEFTTREIKKLKYVQENLRTDGKSQVLGMRNQKRKSLWDYVKYHRNQRKKKLTLKHNKQRTDINDRYDSKAELCTKCRRSIERKQRRSRNRHSSYKKDAWDEDDSRSTEFSEGKSEASAVTKKKSKNWDEKRVTDKKELQDKNSDENSQGKSKLLVEKNPLETEPPYYDIFT